MKTKTKKTKSLENQIIEKHNLSLAKGYKWTSIFMSMGELKKLSEEVLPLHKNLLEEEIYQQNLLLTYRGLRIRIAGTDRFYFGSCELDYQV